MILLIIGSRFLFAPSGDAASLVGLNQVARYINNDDVRSILVQGDIVYVQLKSSTQRLQTRKENNQSLLETLRALGVSEERLQTLPIEVESAPNSGAIFSWLVMILPMLLVFAFFIFIMRQAGGGGQNRAMQFGRSRARKMEGADRPTVTFADVAGSDEAKQELQEVVEFLKEPQKFAALGARIPKGVLMVGAPGTGKTLLAKAVAGEAGVPFFASSGSEFVEMFVGVGASRVRDLFEQAKKNSPCIIFIDEIDAVGRHRGAGLGGGNDEREQTLNQILVEMDGFDTDTNIVIIAATNRPDILDPALLRPGRFDRKVVVDRPDRRGREAILKVHTRGKPLMPDVDLGLIAAQTAGMVGADLENLVNEAAILAARRNKRAIGMSEFIESIERVMAGPARRSRVLDAEDRRVIAYHEAGHAIVMEALEHTEGVSKITIVSRGQSLGYVMPLPEEDRNLRSRAEYEDTLAGLLGGRVAEELIFEEPTTSAANDLERVTKLAKAMVTRFGMSDVIGPLQLNSGDSNPFLGLELGQQRSYSEDVARKIDAEVRRIVSEAYDRARTVLKARQAQLVQVAEALLEKEVLERKEFLRILEAGLAAPETAMASAD
ncbi:ATP-dependent zinc metalloprotease FtsH [Caldilinea sp.]|uniref:ATP-dependent zinc metalloprotease FtsH n=1 Tax=Caldilinea aerophila (strain DSM 14535 / JCM 11387 / NBRC 104270 / STL-6-O1) TaxID=926550 RepID=I0I150_CALAS|nr:ATP-dependent zinc metalloprotease FtsH [Caldilinea sp.]BAL98987.1 cell division protein FtsH [Caldilinea aerophila DSM 14535 = NBRC 104270]